MFWHSHGLKSRAPLGGVRGDKETRRYKKFPMLISNTNGAGHPQFGSSLRSLACSFNPLSISKAPAPFQKEIRPYPRRPHRVNKQRIPPKQSQQYRIPLLEYCPLRHQRYVPVSLTESSSESCLDGAEVTTSTFPLVPPIYQRAHPRQDYLNMWPQLPLCHCGSVVHACSCATTGVGQSFPHGNMGPVWSSFPDSSQAASFSAPDHANPIMYADGPVVESPRLYYGGLMSDVFDNTFDTVSAHQDFAPYAISTVPLQEAVRTVLMPSNSVFLQTDDQASHAQPILPTQPSTSNGRPPLKCDFDCGATFNLAKNQRRHMRFSCKKRPEQPILCQLCSQSFKRPDGLTKHITTVHKMCTKCIDETNYSEQFNTGNEVTKHKEDFHQVPRRTSSGSEVSEL